MQSVMKAIGFETQYPLTRVRVTPAGDHPVVHGVGALRIYLNDIDDSDHPAFISMLRAALRLGMPEYWTSDVIFWDREALRGAAVEDRFIWFVRETGTDLYWIDDKSRALFDVFLGASEAAYRWTGCKLERVRSAHALYIIADFGYVPRDQVRAGWGSK